MSILDNMNEEAIETRDCESSLEWHEGGYMDDAAPFGRSDWAYG